MPHTFKSHKHKPVTLFDDKTVKVSLIYKHNDKGNSCWWSPWREVKEKCVGSGKLYRLGEVVTGNAFV